MIISISKNGSIENNLKQNKYRNILKMCINY